ncbi:MAG: tRNA (5-methylaminomethyl-2-thiouridine)(34)-methyltransferase MnmD [Candidatus Omnitrophica bacterium]|nr:tRNA (5-methylaminomethyl-2-thiouridine)(34)-methyltransferase MnmD [Candidatus Omnitrophota bacterium]
MTESVNQRAVIKWDAQGRPHSTFFDDKYFCQENGLLESEYIFCGGNNLEQRWANLSEAQPGIFTIVETGFGTGLNFCCAWKLWQTHAPKNWRLHYLSLDQFPLKVEDLAKALNLWPELKLYADQLVENYESFNLSNQQIQSVSLEGGQIKLSLIFDHVLKALERFKIQYSKQIDAWFLDGFAPAKNPQMWTNEVFALMAALSYSGTTLSTFTVAGLVRRGLNAQGFSTEKIKGFGQKRQMLIGMLKEDKVKETL